MQKYSRLFFIIALFAMLQAGALSTAVAQDDKTEAIEDMFDTSATEEDYYRTDKMLVTATGSQLPIHRAPAVASIISAEDIEKVGATTLNEVLETVPGLHYTISPASIAWPIYSIRGIHTNNNSEVLLLLNGIPFTASYSSAHPPNFNMPTANISRIEIIRGPGSAVHGADAFAGTINIITKDAHELAGYNAGFRAGSFNTYDAWAQYGGNWFGWDVALSLEIQKSDGDEDRIVESDTQTLFDGMFHTSASNAPGVMESGLQFFDGHFRLERDNWSIRLWSWLLDDAEVGPGATSTLAENINNVDQYLAEISYNNEELSENWDLNFRLSYLYADADFDLTGFPPGAVLLIGSDGNFFTPGGGPVLFPDGAVGNPGRIDQQSAFETWTIYKGFDNHRLRVGAGFKYFQLEPREKKNFGPGVIDGTQRVVDGTLIDVTGTSWVYMPDVDRKLWYLMVQDRWSFAKSWEMTAGVRYDHYSDFGDTINPRFALVWETRYDLTTKLLYGRAFRAPAFQELYVENNPNTIGNSGLDPETIDTVELAFDYQPFPNLHAILNVFMYEIADLIETVEDNPGIPSTTKTFQNSKDQEGYGLEIEADWEITDTIRLYGNFAWRHAEDKDTGKPAPNAPGMEFYLNPHWKFLPDWSADAQFYWIGDRQRDETDTREEIDDYTLVNFTLRRKNIAKHWDFAFSVRNLFDEDIREAAGSTIVDDYPMEGRSFYGEVRFHFE